MSILTQTTIEKTEVPDSLLLTTTSMHPDAYMRYFEDGNDPSVTCLYLLIDALERSNKKKTALYKELKAIVKDFCDREDMDFSKQYDITDLDGSWFLDDLVVGTKGI